MKKMLCFFALCVVVLGYSQPNSINYKALIKDNNGNIVANQTIDIRFTIIANTGPTNVYQEIHYDAVTDNNGIVILNIGAGASTLNTFSSIDWAVDSYSLKVEIDTNLDGSFIDLGTTPFAAVPYALSSLDNYWSKNANGIDTTEGNVGIGEISPNQKLDIDGKIEIGNDNQAATTGAVRFNSISGNFEGYNGTEWVSMNYEPTVYSYEQDPLNESYSSTTRDVLLSFPYTLTIEKPGKYMCFFDMTFYQLKGNTTTLSSDSSVNIQLQIYNQLAFKTIGPDIVGLPNGFTYYFSNYENVQMHRIMDIPTANQTMQIRFRVNSNPCCVAQTSTYYVRDVKMTAIKLD